ncbi:hypothetical protein D3C81_862860 [compost metagenome]
MFRHLAQFFAGVTVFGFGQGVVGGQFQAVAQLGAGEQFDAAGTRAADVVVGQHRRHVTATPAVGEDHVFDVVVEQVGAKFEPFSLVQRTDLVGRRRFRFQVRVAGDHAAAAAGGNRVAGVGLADARCLEGFAHAALDHPFIGQ